MKRFIFSFVSIFALLFANGLKAEDLTPHPLDSQLYNQMVSPQKQKEKTVPTVKPLNRY